MLVLMERPIRIFKGEDHTERITVWDVDLVPDGTVPDPDDADHQAYRADLTGCTIHVRVTAALGGSIVAALSKTNGVGVTLLTQSGATKGQADVHWDAADSATLDAAVYRHQGWVIDATGEVQPLWLPSPFRLERGVPVP